MTRIVTIVVVVHLTRLHAADCPGDDSQQLGDEFDASSRLKGARTGPGSFLRNAEIYRPIYAAMANTIVGSGKSKLTA